VLGKQGTERGKVTLMDGVHNRHSDRIVVTQLHGTFLRAAVADRGDCPPHRIEKHDLVTALAHGVGPLIRSARSFLAYLLNAVNK
jgi:hypothetical protein